MKYYGLELSEFDCDINSFVRVLIDKEDIVQLEILYDKDSQNNKGYIWSAERRGLKILSEDGSHPDYLLLSFHEYEGQLKPLFLSWATSKRAAVFLLKDQGFNLMWQKERRACYKKGEWKLYLSFYGIGKWVFVMELMRGERESLLEQTTNEAEIHTLGYEINTSLEELKEYVKGRRHKGN